MDTSEPPADAAQPPPVDAPADAPVGSDSPAGPARGGARGGTLALHVVPSPTDPRPVMPNGAPRSIRAVRLSHEAIIDHFIANPFLTLKERAPLVGVTPGWLSQIIASDAFRERLKQRQEEVLDPVLKATLDELYNANLRTALDIIGTRLNAAQAPSDAFVLRTAELSARALGFGARPPAAPAVQVNMDLHLASMGEQLTKLLRRERATIEQPPTESEQRAS